MEHAQSTFLTCDGIRTHALIAGKRSSPALVLVHGGEFGASAQLCYENNIGALSRHFFVIAPDMIGFGQTDKIVEFGHHDRHRRRRLHLRRLLDTLGVGEAHFVGNSVGGAILLRDLISPDPQLPIASFTSICGASPDNEEAWNILLGFDGSADSMKNIVALLLHHPDWTSDEYVSRRLRSAMIPGAYEAAAAGRIRAPWSAPPTTSDVPDYGRLQVPTMFVGGAHDRCCPSWPEATARAVSGSRFHLFANSAHCAQLEEPGAFNELLIEFVETS